MSGKPHSSITTHMNFINGEWRSSLVGEIYVRRNPFDQSEIAAYQDSDVADVDLGVAAARGAFDQGPWPRMPAFERGAILRKAASTIRERVDAFVTVMAREVGQPKAEQRKTVLAAADHLDYYAGLIANRRDEAVYGQREDGLGLVVREPIGVVGSLTAWNAPLSIVHKACPGMAAGCTLVVKPAHQSAGASVLLAEVFQSAGLPAGVFNLITSARSNGAVVGQAIAGHEQIDMITFTGSSTTGKAVMRAAANNLKRLKLELGGKSPNVIFEDAPSLDVAARTAATGIFRLAGQSCQAASRLLVQESVHDVFVEKLLAEVARLRLGDPLDDETTIGPLVSEDQLQRIQSYVEIGASCGTLLTGGKRPDNQYLSRGWFFEPTVFDRVDPASRLACEEIFGPVLSILTFRDVDEAIALANSTIFGLVAGCWTSSLQTALRFSRNVRAGGIWVNSYRDDVVLKYLPVGGFKQSGIGREMGPEGLDAFLETKSIMIKLA